MRQRSGWVEEVETVLGERQLAKAGRTRRERMDGRADVVEKPG
jgi:hypothetical protein